MPDPTRSGAVEPSPPVRNYMLALLALWAGDATTAREILRPLARQARGRSREEAFWRDPLGVSALRTLDQLNRRETEYKTLRQAAGLGESADLDMNVRRSQGGHLTGVVWSDSDREFEFRVYVNDFAWEKQFYQATHGLSNTETQRQGRALPSYVSDLPPERDTALDHSWVEIGDLFMQVDVSDVCTLLARCVWTKREMPSTAEGIVDQLQRLLDTLDPDGNEQRQTGNN